MTPDEARRIFVPIFRAQHWPTYALCAAGIVGAVVALVIAAIAGAK